MANIDWLAIKSEYINTRTISYRKLAEKYDISLQAIKDKGAKEKWSAQKKEQQTKIEQKANQEIAEKIIEVEVTRIDKILKLGDKVTEKIDNAITQLEDDNGNIDTYKLRQIVQSMKDLREIMKEDTSAGSEQEKNHDELIAALRTRNEVKRTE